METGKEEEPFGAKVFKISRDNQGNRLTHLKVTSGVLHVKDCWGEEEKVNQIRIYSGAKFESVKEAAAGCICAVTGPLPTHPGQGIGSEPGFGAAYLGTCAYLPYPSAF